MKAMFEVIKYEGDNSTLVYKYPVEDFNTKSRLVVQQAQEAIFYYKGQMADRFDVPDTYVLNTQNIPILRGLVNLPFGKESPFHAVIYFVNKTEQMNNRWGVGDIPFIDKSYPIPLKTGISGEYSFKVNDVVVFMNKLVGTLSEFTGAKLKETLDSFLKARITHHLSNFYKDNEIDLFTIETNIETIANFLETKIRDDFYDYGIEITKFIATNIVKREETPEYKRYYEFRTQQLSIIDIQNQGARDLAAAEQAKQVAIKQKEADVTVQQMQQDTDARGVVVDSNAQAIKRQQEGYTYQQERGFDVAERTAENEGVGNFASAGMGIGVGMGVAGVAAGAVGSMYNDALNAINTTNSPEQEPSSKQVENGYNGVGLDDIDNNNVQADDNSSQARSKKERLRELKELFDEELIDEAEYKEKKAAILAEV